MDHQSENRYKKEHSKHRHLIRITTLPKKQGQFEVDTCFYLKICTCTEANMYPGGKVQENVGHRGWWLSVIRDLVWSCRCCTRCTTYFIWGGQKFILVVLSTVIWCDHMVWLDKVCLVVCCTCTSIWCGQNIDVVICGECHKFGVVADCRE